MGSLVRVLALLSCVLIGSCRKEKIDEVVVVSSCDFDSSITVETETPLPVYSISLHYTGCNESIAVFRENLNYSGDLPVRLGSDLQTVTTTFTNSVGAIQASDQSFTASIPVDDIFIVVGGGEVVNGLARLTYYAPPDADSYFRLFNDSGWLSAYESNATGLCSSGTSTFDTIRPETADVRVDNDSGWGDDVILNYTFNPVTGQYQACISGLDDYTIEWNVNDTIYFGDDVEVIVGKPNGIYFISATIFYNDERITLSHTVLKTIAGRSTIRRARIRRPTGG